MRAKKAEAREFERSAIRQKQAQPAKAVTLPPIEEKLAKAREAVNNAEAVCKRCDGNRKATADRMRKSRGKA